MSDEKTKPVESGCRCGRLKAIRAQLEEAKRKAEEPTMMEELDDQTDWKKERPAEG